VAVDGIWSEPFFGPDSLLTGKSRGNLANLGFNSGSRVCDPVEDTMFSPVYPVLEFKAEQGIITDVTGNRVSLILIW
jgi:hypothetical protein